jgi:putative transposase
MEGKGRCLGNVFVERLWRTVKYVEVYLKSYVSLVDAHAQLDRFFRFCNERRPHSSLDASGGVNITKNRRFENHRIIS